MSGWTTLALIFFCGVVAADMGFNFLVSKGLRRRFGEDRGFRVLVLTVPWAVAGLLFGVVFLVGGEQLVRLVAAVLAILWVFCWPLSGLWLRE